ncbi:Cyanobacterial aminoacyl-tRNA synthetase, CAAD domain [Dillenia turbinata]|uniref:Cyanobacterial aminoacyl-tRNA synthetase, CAAD domain n=1 Tax=Dillenia turbinata TaxID=194707 RepID=A0AAN8UZQ8_9MAGN
MELCTIRAVSNLPHTRGLSPNPITFRRPLSLALRRKTSVSLSHRISLHIVNSSVRETTSEEASSGESPKFGESYGGVTMQEVSPVENKVYNEVGLAEEPNDEAPEGEFPPLSEFLEKLNLKFESEDTSSIVVYGGGALVAIWLASVVVGAIDSIPLIPKFMEIVGLGYTIWFSTRYLIFKKNRDELGAKIEELKQQVLGLDDN